MRHRHRTSNKLVDLWASVYNHDIERPRDSLGIVYGMELLSLVE